MSTDRTACIAKLLDIQELCNREVLEGVPDRVGVAEAILKIITDK